MTAEQVSGERDEHNLSSFTVFALLLFTGCASIGPGTVTRDRFDYVTAISDSWKSQMLFNLVKLRYGDAPVFLDVASVINQYLVEGAVGFSGNWAQNPQLRGRTRRSTTGSVREGMLRDRQSRIRLSSEKSLPAAS